MIDPRIGSALAEISIWALNYESLTKLDFPTSWGQMILDKSKLWQSQSWMLIGPSLAIALITLAFTSVGDGLRDALDPRETR